MLVHFTVGATTTTLADDTNADAGGKIAFGVDGVSWDSEMQVNRLFRAATVFKSGRLNVDRKFNFTAEQSFANVAAVYTYLKAIDGLISSTGTLVFKVGASTLLTGNNATLKAARVNRSDNVGVRCRVAFNFEITTYS